MNRIDLDWEWGMSGGFDISGQDVFVSLANGTTYQLAYFQKAENGWTKKTVNTGDLGEHVSILKLSNDRKQLIFDYSTASIPNQVHLSDIQPSASSVSLISRGKLSHLNKYLDKKEKAKTEVVNWTGALNENVTGVLYYPHDYKEGKKYPLMIAIHGGPAGADMDRWSDRWAYHHNLIAQKGCFILKPNYHGSGNHGQKFVESIKGHYYEYEIPDILAGIDMLDERGLINKDSMAVMGWSNGAIITTMLTVQYPDMFLAATPGAGDVNWTSDFGTCQFGVTFDQSYFGGAPWDDINGKTYNEAYILKSPLFELEKVKTPTLIFHGSEDRAVPRDQGWEYYRALQQSNKAHVRFLWFPGQPHGLQKITHQKRKMEEELAWFDTYFFGKPDTSNEAVKKESPLIAFIEKEKCAKASGLYGQMYKSNLIPESVSVKKDSISIGRFELTHAQYQAFNRKHKIPAGQENYPVTGIGLSQAKAYVQWLSKLTGQSYRLPNAIEAKAMQKSSLKLARKENTLRYWAGYDITLDEVELFRKKLSNVKASLIREVGMYEGTKLGAAMIYDLGGNVAEYYSESGKSGTYGYSAYDYADPNASYENIPDEHTGLRVIKDPKVN